MKSILPKIQMNLSGMIWTLSLSAAISAYLSLILQKDDFIIASKKLQKMQQTGTVQVLDQFTVQLYNCPRDSQSLPQNCKKVHNKPRNLPLTNQKTTSSQLSDLLRLSNFAVLSYQLTDSDREFLQQFHAVSLVSPAFVQRWAELHLAGQKTQRQIGMTNDNTFPITSQLLLEAGQLQLNVDFSGLSYFGSLEQPFAFTDPNYAREYSHFFARKKIADQYYQQIEFGLPAVLAAMSVIFDHAQGLTLVTYYGISQAFRAFVFKRIRESTGLTEQIFTQLFYFLNCLTSFILLLAINKLCRLPAWKRPQILLIQERRLI